MNESYIFVNLMGGVGNQLFQYAAGLLQQKETNGTLILCKPHTNIHDTQDYRKILFNNAHHHDDDNLPSHVTLYQDDGYAPWDPSDWKYPIVFLYGYFQHYPTLKPIMPHFKQTILESLEPYIDKVRKSDYRITFSSIFIHVRRGDYVNNKDIPHLYDLEYYKKAYNTLLKKRIIYRVFVFSDDIEWCKNQSFFKSIDCVYVEETDPIFCLALMSQIKDGAIIANSTFSWMGAYLGCGLQNVVYPKNWVTDKTVSICPEEWIEVA